MPRQTLRRWLVARKWDVEAAKRALVVHAEWRAQNLPHGRITEDEVRGAPGVCRAAWLSQQKHICTGPFTTADLAAEINLTALRNCTYMVATM